MSLSNIFSGNNKTLEAQVAQLTADLATATGQVATLTQERDDARAQADTLTTQLATANADLATAKGQVTTLTADLSGSKAAGTAILAAIVSTLELDQTAADALAPETFAATFKAAVETIAGKKAVALAASQGTPPVQTTPAASGGQDEFAQACAEAAQIKDPVARAKAFARARETKFGKN